MDIDLGFEGLSPRDKFGFEGTFDSTFDRLSTSLSPRDKLGFEGTFDRFSTSLSPRDFAWGDGH
jgi:hypothetical protein